MPQRPPSSIWRIHKRQRYEARRRAAYQRWRRQRNKVRGGVPEGEEEQTRKAPAVFSMIENPNEMSEFCRDLAHDQERCKKVFIELGDVKRMTIDGVGVLLAIVRNAPFDVGVAGNRPKDPKVRETLEDSGFFGFVSSRDKPPKTETRGRIFKRYHDKVDALIAQALINHVSEKLYGAQRRMQPCQSILLEAMQNTKNHAGSAGRTTWWWATALVDSDKGKAYFCFVDRGVGIMKSVKVRPIRKAIGAVTGTPGILRDILKGEIGSRTGLAFRGKGLPWIYETAKQGRVQNLVVIANDVYGAATADNYQSLSPGFGGTLIAWEVRR